MDTAAFLRHILADDGYKCICIKLEKGTHHRFFQSFEDAAQFALASDARGLTVYHACATFLSQSNRKQENVAWLKSLYSDVDVGADKPYKTRSEASAALTDFLAATGLPGPTVVYSGPVGMHLYWVLEQALPPARWRPYAVALRALMRQRNSSARKRGGGRKSRWSLARGSAHSRTNSHRQQRFLIPKFLIFHARPRLATQANW